MLVSLPDELKNQLLDLAECGVYVAVDQYTDDETKQMEQLHALGLVAKGWVLTPAGHQRIRAQQDQDADEMKNQADKAWPRDVYMHDDEGGAHEDRG